MQFSAYIETLEKGKEIYLSPNFTLYDLIFSETAINNKIPNIPNETQKNNLIFLANALLEPLALLFENKFKITSGFRCEELNKLVGGSPNSKHLEGLAVDFIPQKIGLRPSVYKIKNSDLTFDKCILEFRWIHISIQKKNNRRDFYEAIKSANNTINYLPFFDKF